MNGTELISLTHFQYLTKIAYPDISRNFDLDRIQGPDLSRKLEN